MTLPANRASWVRQLCLTATLAVAVLLACSAPSAWATLVITNADIVGGHYKYDLTFSETANNSVLNADALSVVRLTCYVDNWGPQTLHEVLAYYTNSTSAWLVYRFDFSQTAYRPTALALRERFTLFTGVHGPDSTLGWSGWSADQSTWTTITSVTTPPGPGIQVADVITNYTSLISGLPDVVYYRMSLTTLPGDGDGLTADHNQWNRLAADNAGSFLADFTVAHVPEPMTAILFLGSTALAAARATRRLRHAS